MKITGVHPWLVKASTSYWGEYLFVEVTTDAGVSGWGEITSTTKIANRALCAILKQMSAQIAGEDPARIEMLWHKMFRSFTYMGSRGAACECVSAIDIALWDIRGKVLGLPVYELLGGAVRDEISLYTHPDQSKFTSEQGVIDEITDIVKSGHKALKFDPYPYQRGGDESRHGYLDGMMTRADEKKAADLTALIRKTAGPEVEILIDAHGRFDVPTAIRLCRSLEEAGQIDWFEEPVPPESYGALKQVREKVNAAISVGERAHTKWDFVRILEDKLTDYIMPDVTWTGGISELKKIATLAEAFYVPISPHDAGGPINVLAGAHVMMTVPNFYRLETSRWDLSGYNELMHTRLDNSNGALKLPRVPGLGIELDRDYLENNKIETVVKMKITGIETVVVNAVHRNWIFVKVLTDQPGLWGWGEATLEWKTRAIKGTIEDLAPFLIGQDPMRIEHLVNTMTRFSFWPLGSIGLTAVSGIEHALWDIKGKALGVPVWQLLGGKVRDRVRVYTHLRRGSSSARVSNQDIPAFVDAVQETVEMGYDAIKLGFVPYTGYDAPLPAVKHVEKLAAAVRERVGDGVDIMTDFHGRPDSLDAAIAYIKAIEPIKPLFCEEVIQPGDTAAMADIARRVDCPLATGERLFTPREFAEVAETRAVAYVQPDLAHCMGISGGRKIAAIAEAAHQGVCPHNPMGPVAGAVALQFDAATTNFVIQEEAVGIVPWFEEICSVYPLQLDQGSWLIPEAPGLGIEIDEKAAAKYPFAQEIIPALDSVLKDGRIANW